MPLPRLCLAFAPLESIEDLARELVHALEPKARDANHVHTGWRDPEADFGDDVLREHYARSH